MFKLLFTFIFLFSILGNTSLAQIFDADVDLSRMWPLSGKHHENNKYCYCEEATKIQVNKKTKEVEIQIAKRPGVWFSTEGAPIVYSADVTGTWYCDMNYGKYRVIIKPFTGT